MGWLSQFWLPQYYLSESQVEPSGCDLAWLEGGLLNVMFLPEDGIAVVLNLVRMWSVVSGK